jgi:hypothetical protein
MGLTPRRTGRLTVGRKATLTLIHGFGHRRPKHNSSLVQWLRLALSKGFNGVVAFLPSPEDGNKSSFSNIQNCGRWKKPRNPVILSVLHHHQNPSDSAIRELVTCFARSRYYFAVPLCSGLTQGANKAPLGSCSLAWLGWPETRSGAELSTHKQHLSIVRRDCISTARIVSQVYRNN